MLHVEPVRHLEQHPAPVFAVALVRQCRPGGVALCRDERLGIGGLVGEPVGNVLGVAPFPGGDRLLFVGGHTHQVIELEGEARPVERCGVFLLYPLDRAALNKEPLDRV